MRSLEPLTVDLVAAGPAEFGVDHVLAPSRLVIASSSSKATREHNGADTYPEGS
jgi:hypothetical protein